MKTTKEETSLVQVMQPTAVNAFDQAKQMVDALPSLRLPIIVRDAENQSLVVDMLRQVTGADKAVVAKQKSVTVHLDAAKKVFVKLFEPLKTHLRELRSDLEGTLDEYRDWQAEEAEKEREALRKKAEVARRRAEKTAEKNMYAAASRQMRSDIKRRLDAKLEVQAAILDSRLEEIDGTPDAEEGVAVIQDVEITDLDLDVVPRFMAIEGVDLPLWYKEPLNGNIKKLLKAGIEIPGVTFERKTRRAVRSL